MARVAVPTFMLLVMMSVFAIMRFRVVPLAPSPGEPTLGGAPEWLIPFAATAMVAYFLVWKYAVGFLNAEVGIG